VIETRIPILYLHATLAPGAGFEQQVPKSENAFAYVIEGSGEFGDSPASASQLVVFDRSAENIRVCNTGSTPLDVLLIAGEPIGEPVARYGPFVMTSREEVLQAVEDYRSGKMGVLA
jgi:redox-sensitive bicupin YhaK (pirin superfamily)